MDKNIVKANQFNVEEIIRIAVEKNVKVESMEKLLKMRKELKEEWAREQFFENLSALQEKLPSIKKDQIVRNKDGTIRYKYASLETIVDTVKPLLKEYGFSYIIDSVVKENTVKAICKVVHKFGHSETTSFEAPIDKTAYMNAPQMFASALTYAKRYAFCNAFGIMTADEDDDTAKTFEIKTNHLPASPEKKSAIKPASNSNKCPYCGTTGRYHAKTCPNFSGNKSNTVKNENEEVEKQWQEIKEEIKAKEENKKVDEVEKVKNFEVAWINAHKEQLKQLNLIKEEELNNLNLMSKERYNEIYQNWKLNKNIV
jgi:hypothetical protein